MNKKEYERFVNESGLCEITEERKYCPKCGNFSRHTDESKNYLSNFVDISICPDCHYIEEQFEADLDIDVINGWAITRTVNAFLKLSK